MYTITFDELYGFFSSFVSETQHKVFADDLWRHITSQYQVNHKENNEKADLVVFTAEERAQHMKQLIEYACSPRPTKEELEKHRANLVVKYTTEFTGF